MDADLAAQVMPYIAAAATAYGAAVLERVRDAAADSTADATLGWGRRILRRILGRDESDPVIATVVEDLADDPGDEDRVAAVRAQVRKALAADPQLAADIAQMLAQSRPTFTASGDRSVAVQHNPGIVQTGDHTSARQERA